MTVEVAAVCAVYASPVILYYNNVRTQRQGTDEGSLSQDLSLSLARSLSRCLSVALTLNSPATLPVIEMCYAA